MFVQDIAYYDLIGRSLQGITYQEFVDRFNEKYNIPQTEGFMWDDEIQMDFTYHQLEAEMGIYTMATYVDVDSPAPYKSLSGAEVSTGKIPRMKHGFAMNEKIIREKMLLAKEGVFSNATQEAMFNLLFNSTDQLIGGNYNSLTYQRHQAVSKGKLEIAVGNNPQGIKGLTFDFGIPSGNITTKTSTARWWTDATLTTEGAAANPMADLQALVDAAEDTPIGHIEMSKTLWRKLMTHTKFLPAIGYLAYPLAADDTAATNVAKRLSLEEAQRLLENKLGYPVVIIDSKVAVDSYDKATKKMVSTSQSAFNIYSVVVVPLGELGTIKSVQPLVVPDPAARIAYFDGGRTVLKQTFDAKLNVQYIESELTALCVPNKRNYMFYLYIQ